MVTFWNAVNKTIEKADILIEVLDARLVDETRNIEIEKKIQQKGKKLIYVINKADLVSRKMLAAEKAKLQHAVIFSAKDRQGTAALRQKIMAITHGKECTVGVLGYPNVGKSSVINALSRKGKARTSPTSGYTKGVQMIRADTKIHLFDTPGVLPYKEEDQVKHALTGSLSYEKVKDPDLVAMRLIENLNGRVEIFYGIQPADDPLDALEAVAVKLNFKIKGGGADIDRAGRKIVQDWQTGKISLK